MFTGMTTCPCGVADSAAAAAARRLPLLRRRLVARFHRDLPAQLPPRQGAGSASPLTLLRVCGCAAATRVWVRVLCRLWYSGAAIRFDQGDLDLISTWSRPDLDRISTGPRVRHASRRRLKQVRRVHLLRRLLEPRPLHEQIVHPVHAYRRDAARVGA